MLSHKRIVLAVLADSHVPERMHCIPDSLFESWSILEYGTDMIALLKTKKHISDQKLFFETAIDSSQKKYLFIDKSKFKLTIISKDKSLLFLGCH